MYTLRAASSGDLDDLAAAARHLDSVNLPNDRGRLAQIIETSTRSFAGELPPPRRELLFVLAQRGEDRERVVGASMIFAQHGSRQAPHVYFDVIDEERYSETLDRHFRHTLLRIGYNYRGLTEVGGLVLVPELRGHPERLGALLSYGRFMYIALHRPAFRDDVVAELMPPLESDGTSLLWEALGRRFTGLSYQEADRLSRENKEFIRALFPQDPIYATLLPPQAQALIGKVGPSSQPVERLLRRIGFEYARRIDPFDGGPHFQARTDDIALVKATRRVTVRGLRPGSDLTTDALVARVLDHAPHFVAARARVILDAAGDELALAESGAAALGVTAGDAVAVLPL